jgi:hypothetical protein
MRHLAALSGFYTLWRRATSRVRRRVSDAGSEEEADELFPGPLIPSDLVFAEAYPATHQFLRRHVDMQIADLRVLFRLPSDHLDPHVGCNLTTAAMMLNLISGFSVWFFQTEEAAHIKALEAKGGNRRSRRRFKEFIKAYWPQIPPEPSSDEVAKRLYDVRNSLAHSLGVNDKVDDDDGTVQLMKRAYDLETIAHHFERNLAHPLAVPVVDGTETNYRVHLGGLYWALHHMLKTALQDRPKEIEATIATFVVPDVPASSIPVGVEKPASPETF